VAVSFFIKKSGQKNKEVKNKPSHRKKRVSLLLHGTFVNINPFIFFENCDVERIGILIVRYNLNIHTKDPFSQL
jgi:hypothetical protein